MIGCTCTTFCYCDTCGKTAVAALTQATSNTVANWYHGHYCLDCFVLAEQAMREVTERASMHVANVFCATGMRDGTGKPKLAQVLLEEVPNAWLVWSGGLLGFVVAVSPEKAGKMARKQWPEFSGKMTLTRKGGK